MRKLALLLMFPIVAFALEVQSIDSVNVTVSYTEPTTKADGSPLDDLSHTTIFYNSGVGWVEVTQIAATGPGGGGLIAQQVTLPIEEGQEVDVQVTATASDQSGNESVQAIPAQIRIDRLAPAAPL